MAERRPAGAGGRATVVVRGGTVIDETGERRADVLISDGTVTAVGPDLDIPAKATVLDAGGCLVVPGLVDLHTHLRQPGGEEAETVETAARAAARGGYTAVVGMPNTNPPMDSAAVAREVLQLGETALCQVAVAGAITVGRAGQCLRGRNNRRRRLSGADCADSPDPHRILRTVHEPGNGEGRGRRT